MPVKTKRRYLALKIESEENISQNEFISTLWEYIIKLFGEYGASKTGLTLIEYQEIKRLAIIRVLHKEVETVRAAIAAVKKVKDKPAAVHVLKVSGTLRALREKLNIQS